MFLLYFFLFKIDKSRLEPCKKHFSGYHETNFLYHGQVVAASVNGSFGAWVESNLIVELHWKLEVNEEPSCAWIQI